ncbi:MAG: DNA repair exonuclease [Myxococcota bacterium]
MVVRLLHTADWQIGKRFEYVGGDAAAILRQQRLKTVDRIGQLALDEAVDAVLVAGDVFEVNTVSDDTVRKLLLTLAKYPVPFLLLPGNHDAATAGGVWSRIPALAPPEHVHLLLEPRPLTMPGFTVFPAPLRRRHEPEDCTSWFDDAPSPVGHLRIGLAHGCVQDRLPNRSANDNPISDRRASSARLDYLALGDWHGTLQIAERTWYSGTPESDSFRNNDSGNVLLVEFEGASSPPRVQRKRTSTYRFRQLECELSETSDLDALEAQLLALEEPELSVCNLLLRGTLPVEAHASLSARLDPLRSRFFAASIDDSNLAPRACAHDLAELSTGMVGEAVRTLLHIAEDPSHPESEYASRALSILVLEHRQLSRSMP